MKIRSHVNFASGILFMLAGTAAAWVASGYQMGTAARLGPGYFPFWLGIVLGFLGELMGKAIN